MISHVSIIIFLMSISSLLIWNFLFSYLLISRASSTKFSKWYAEFCIIYMYVCFLLSVSCCNSFLDIGIIEFSGVLSSWAIDEKNMAFIFLVCSSSNFILVMLLKMTRNVSPLPIIFDLMLKYLIGSENLKI